MVDMIKEQLGGNKQCKNRFTLDGFPQAVPQAMKLNLMLQARKGHIAGDLIHLVSRHFGHGMAWVLWQVLGKLGTRHSSQ